jgi:transcriptional antiterminator
VFAWKYGGVNPILVEHPLTIIRLYRAKWLRDKFNIEQKTLARLHYQEGLTIKQLSERFKVSLSTIKATLYGLGTSKNRKS